jgi:hypothetical protein
LPEARGGFANILQELEQWGESQGFRFSLGNFISRRGAGMYQKCAIVDNYITLLGLKNSICMQTFKECVNVWLSLLLIGPRR